MTLHIDAIELVGRGGALISTPKGEFSRHPHPSGRVWWLYRPAGCPPSHGMLVTIAATANELEDAYQCELVYVAAGADGGAT